MKEQALVNSIIQLIQYRGGIATRINSGMVTKENEDGGRYVIRGAKKGTSDILACFKGKYIAIECKVGDNKPTVYQAYFLESVTNAGGIACVAYSAETVIELLDEIEGNSK